MNQSKGRVLVTGAGTGIGKAVALELACNGFDIALHCNSHVEAANAVAQEIIELGQKAVVFAANIADESATREAIEKDINEHGAYWGVVANAGITADNAFPAMSSDEWHGVINTNLNGFYHVLNPCIMPMIHLRKGGRIVAISSVSGIVGNRGQANYYIASGPISNLTFDGAPTDIVEGGEVVRSEEHTSELQSPDHLVCRLLLEKKKKN